MQVIDVSKDTDPRLHLPRLRQPIGIVIHASGGTNSLAWLQGHGQDFRRPVSADQLIARDGTIYVLVPSDHYAYHSGIARWNGLQGNDGTLNRLFIGIEVENLEDGFQSFTDAQYVSLAASIANKMLAFPISMRNICTHYECALPHGRKVDPVIFDMPRLTRLLLAGWPRP